MIHRPTLVILGLLAVAGAQAQTFKVTDFHSSGVTNGDRTFVSTKFVGSTTTLTSANINYFQDGTLSIPGASGGTYGWNDVVKGDFLPGTDIYAVNPDRGDNSTPFANESTNPKGAKLKDVFGGNNLSYMMDAEDTNVTWSLDLKYGTGKYITYDGNANSPELLLMERGHNSLLGVRAILANGTYSNSFVLNFNTSGTQAGVAAQAALADYTVNTTEITSNQQIGALGLSLSAFGLSAGTKVYGYQFYVDEEHKNLWNGPDMVGFISGKTAPVPEPATMAVLGLGILPIIRRKRAQK